MSTTGQATSSLVDIVDNLTRARLIPRSRINKMTMLTKPSHSNNLVRLISLGNTNHLPTKVFDSHWNWTLFREIIFVRKYCACLWMLMFYGWIYWRSNLQLHSTYRTHTCIQKHTLYLVWLGWELVLVNGWKCFIMVKNIL